MAVARALTRGAGEGGHHRDDEEGDELLEGVGGEDGLDAGLRAEGGSQRARLASRPGSVALGWGGEDSSQFLGSTARQRLGVDRTLQGNAAGLGAIG